MVLSILVSGCQRNSNNDVGGSSAIKTEIGEEESHENTEKPAQTTFLPENQNTKEPSIAPAQPQTNVKVLASIVNIREDKTTQSRILKKAKKHNIFKMLDEAVDSDNKTWYLIEYDFGAQGWIAGWFCEKTKEEAYVFKSEKGKLLNSEVDEELFISTLLLQEYTKESFEKVYGYDYKIGSSGVYTSYQYPNGLYFELDRENEFVRFMTR